MTLRLTTFFIEASGVFQDILDAHQASFRLAFTWSFFHSLMIHPGP
jgi:hypothetical protein